jgi:carboxyl-terminal processing protease
VNEGSASASEIIAGAIQDHDRGIIIGTPTYGKGLVQEQYELSNGGALRLTVARYYTPSGRLIQKPYSNGASVAENGQEDSDTSLYHTTAGREVNGSGGITPDILVEPEFKWDDKGMGHLYSDILEYAIHGYHSDTTYTSVDDMIARFPSGTEIATDVIRYYENHVRKERKINVDLLQENNRYARMMLMAMISSVKFGHDSWFRVMNAGDPVVQKALEVIKDDRKTTLKY